MLKKVAMNNDTAQNIFKDWVEVKKKHKKCRKKEVTEPNKNLAESPDSQDYRIRYKSKKKRKQHRDRDEELATCLSNLKTEDKASGKCAYGIQETSRTIKKEKPSKMKSRCESLSNIIKSKLSNGSKHKKSKKCSNMIESSCDIGEEQCKDPDESVTNKFSKQFKNVKPILKKKKSVKNKEIKKLSKKLKHSCFFNN